MIIDFHTHVFPEKIAQKTIDLLTKKANGTPSTNGTIEGLIEAMKRGNADIAVTLPVLTKASQFDSVTKFAIEINERFKDVTDHKLISFGGMHPECEDIEGKMRYLKENGIKGVKIHPDYQNTFIDHEGYYQILKTAKDLDMIVVTHSGVDDGYIGESVKCPPLMVKKVLERLGGFSKFVLGHYGAHKQWYEVLDLLAGEDVYFDTAFTFHEIDEKLFKKILSKHGEDKILFATDCPWRDIKDDVAILKSFNLPKEVEEKLFYKNAKKLLGI
ncbi:MAG: hypothetical protein E7362_04005 [Clostridiales bacterium]|nr:hypothetical protein [Clostridiales bacterium]